MDHSRRIAASNWEPLNPIIVQDGLPQGWQSMAIALSMWIAAGAMDNIVHFTLHFKILQLFHVFTVEQDTALICGGAYNELSCYMLDPLLGITFFNTLETPRIAAGLAVVNGWH